MAYHVASTAGPSRPQTFALPALHLGSFHGLTSHSIPTPTSPNSTSPIPSYDLPLPDLPPSRRLRSQASRDDILRGSRGHRRGSQESPLRDVPRRSVTPESLENSVTDKGLVLATTFTMSSRADQKSLPPGLPPLSLTFPALPALPSISPLENSAFIGLPSTPVHDLARPDCPITSPLTPSAIAGLRYPPFDATKVRPLGPSLTVHIPSPSGQSPTSSKDLHLPSLRNSPGIPRRRTLIEASPAASRAAPLRVSQMMESMPLSDDDSPLKKATEVTDSRGPIQLASARPTTSAVPPARGEPLGSAETTAPGEAIQELSGVSPTTKRSLPKPPIGERSSSGQPTRSEVRKSDSSGTFPAGAQQPNLSTHTGRVRLPSTSTSWPVPSSSRDVSQPSTSHLRPVQPQPAFLQKHQPTKSASSLPVVAGLADAGPYPSASPVPQANRPGDDPGAMGLGRPPNRPGQSRPPIQEEVCLECLMRDRDLADVDVQGEGALTRTSDVDWQDLRWREDTLMRAMGRGGSLKSHGTPSLDHSEASDSENTSASPLSTGNSLEDAENRRSTAIRKQRREASRQQRKETDWRVVREVGWRGFAWEEERGGSGLPRAFRGARGGPLTEDGIKAVLAKFPRPSEVRYNTLKIYLENQAQLVKNIQRESMRLGRYLQPDEVLMPGVLSLDTPVVAAGPRTSSMAWEAKHTRELSDQMRGAFISPQGHTKLSLVRPSPSSPADLASPATVRNAPLTLQRPLTLYIPDREPVSGRSQASISSVRPLNIQKLPVSSSRATPEFPDFPELEEDPWSSNVPSDSLRPFSFAVRAGAVPGRDGSEGHGRRSFFGRFGGSVTSLFGGSNGGSGSMLDMHLGLEDDRLAQGALQTNGQPRAASMASPHRPLFFGRESRPGSVNNNETHLTNSLSTSRLSQVVKSETDEEPSNGRTKGLKSLLKKMKPKGSHKTSARSDSEHYEAYTRRDDDCGPQPYLANLANLANLAPPPPMTFLVGKGQRQQIRDRSDSLSSMTDSSVVGSQRHSGQLPYSLRSVSAPQGGSSSGGSPNVSPSSTKFATAGPNRESYASARGRRASNFGDIREAYERRRSNVEVLASGNRIHASPEPTPTLYEEPYQIPRGAQAATHNAPHVATYPPAANRGFHNVTTSTLSNYTFIETPPIMTSHALPFFAPNQPTSHSANSQGPPTNLSPNRFKNLPPLPPLADELSSGIFSRDPYSPVYCDYPDPHLRTKGSNLRLNGQHQLAEPYPLLARNNRVFAPLSSPQYDTYRPPRASLDPSDSARPPRRENTSPRLAQSMYVQPAAAGSTGSFGRFFASNTGKGLGGRKNREVQTPVFVDLDDVAERRAPKHRKGLKGFFGTNKAGRLA